MRETKKNHNIVTNSYDSSNVLLGENNGRGEGQEMTAFMAARVGLFGVLVKPNEHIFLSLNWSQVMMSFFHFSLFV